MKRHIENSIGSEEHDLNILYTDAQVADMLLLPKKTVQKLVREKKLSCVQITSRIRRFTPEQVQRYIDSHSTAIAVDKKDSRPISSPPKKGGEKSIRVSGTGLIKEMRSLCRS